MISAVAIVLALVACQPIYPETIAVEVEPPVPGVNLRTADPRLDYDASHIKLDQLEWAIQRWEEFSGLDPNFDRIIALAPDSANSYFFRGVAYADLGDLARAIQDFDKTIQLDPDHAPAYFNRGVAYAALGKSDAAVHDFEASLMIDPDASYAPQIRAMLAELHAQQE